MHETPSAWDAPADLDLDLPEGFYPLRLVLQPTGQTVELTRPEMLLGRHSDADIQLPQPDVSRRHCRLTFAEGGWEVCDLNSLNGLYVNGERVRQTVLRHHDRVVIGGFRLEVDLSSGPDVLSLAPTADGGHAHVLQSIVDALTPREAGSTPKRLAS